MEKNDDYYMKLAIKEAKKAYRKDEIPVGAVIYSIDEDRIIAKGHNERDSKNIVIKHAEISAIIKANKVMNNWRLPNTILYTTLEPCDMCMSIIKEAKVEKVIYGAYGKNKKTEKNIFQIGNDRIIKECENLVKNKFIEIRNN
jgi:tRNA(adenine34) deaminase